jgi:hypothetical protein
MAMLTDLNTIFRKRGIRLELAGRKRQLLAWFKKAEVTSGHDGIYVHSDLYQALRKNNIKHSENEVIDNLDINNTNKYSVTEKELNTAQHL